MVEGNAEAHAGLVGGLGPFAEEVALGAEVDGVPRLVSRIPVVEIVVVNALDEQKPRADVLVKLNDRRRVEFRRVPVLEQILVSGLGRMAEIPDVIVIGRLTLHIEPARVPVAAHARRLRPEMHPDAEFGVAQPGDLLAGIIPGDGIPRGGIRPRHDGKIHPDLWKRRRVAHRHGTRGPLGREFGNWPERRQGSDGRGPLRREWKSAQ